MTAEVWIHVIELVIVALLIPSAKSLVSVVVGLRDATRDLTAAVRGVNEKLSDHEDRLRDVESAYAGPERRHRATRGEGLMEMP